MTQFPQKLGPNFYLTLDFEDDLGSAIPENSYFSHEGSAHFISFIQEKKWPVCLFVTGEILEQFPELLRPYLSFPELFSFGLHAYNHAAVFGSKEERLKNLEMGLQAYQKFFNKSPSLYRAPNGMISRSELELLAAKGVPAGSNFFPAYFPGRFNHLHISRHPFRIKETGFIEIPFSVTRLLRIPIALSYAQLFGKGLFDILAPFDRIEQLVFDFHLHDLYPEYWYERLPLSRGMKLAYSRAANSGYAFKTFERMTQSYEAKGFSFKDLHGYVEQLQQEDLPEISLSALFP